MRNVRRLRPRRCAGDVGMVLEWYIVPIRNKHTCMLYVESKIKGNQNHRLGVQLTLDFTGTLFRLRPPFFTSRSSQSLDPELRFVPRLRRLWSLPPVTRPVTGSLPAARRGRWSWTAVAESELFSGLLLGAMCMGMTPCPGAMAGTDGIPGPTTRSPKPADCRAFMAVWNACVMRGLDGGCCDCCAEVAISGGAGCDGFWVTPLEVFLSLLPSPEPFFSLDPLAVLSLEPSPDFPLFVCPLVAPPLPLLGCTLSLPELPP